jgi:hypothetical protein
MPRDRVTAPQGAKPKEDPRHMPRPIRLDAFDMNCVVHQSPGLWPPDPAELALSGRREGTAVPFAVGASK